VALAWDWIEKMMDLRDAGKGFWISQMIGTGFGTET